MKENSLRTRSWILREQTSVMLRQLLLFPWGGGPKEKSSADILFGADQASVDDILQYLGNDMSQVNRLTCLNLQARGLLTAGYIIVSYSSLGD